MALQDTTDHTAYHEPRCEFAETLFTEGECQKTGEVKFDGSLLCVPHAELLKLKVRECTLLGTVFELDKWLDNPNHRADELRWRRLLRERDEVVDQLRFNRMLLEAHEEAIQHR